MPPPLIKAGAGSILEEEEEEDSFFELEIALPHSDDNECSTNTSTSVEVETSDNTRSFPEKNITHDCTNKDIQASATDGRCKGGIFQQRCVTPSPGEKSFSRRKILPIEGLHRSQSPISLLKSAPKFRFFMFAESKSTAAAKEEAGREQGRNRGSALLPLKFKAKEIHPFFVGSGSLRKGENESRNDNTCSHCSNDSGASKRFSRDVILKYLRLVKPLYMMASKKQGNGETFAKEFPAAATSVSPPLLAGNGKPPVGSRSKQFGKSRSASAGTSSWVVSPARMDDSLWQQHDGIQSAILHCKRSFSVSRDFSPLSRCEAGSAHEEETIDIQLAESDKSSLLIKRSAT